MTTLEKIKAEIEEEVNKHYEEWSYVAGLMTAKDIFEKYASEECDRDCEHCIYLECPIEPCEDAVDGQLKIGEEIYIRANANEIRNDYIICENKGGYFGTVREEIYPSVQPKTECDHPDKCHECEKILTCDYYKRGAK